MTPIEAMRLALGISRAALPDCRPNPPVGCVILGSSGVVVATGHTQIPGSHHAEAAALARIEGPLGECHAFVTLEPCSFHGRTPSCAKTLVQRQIGAVSVAIEDPDPRNSGRGVQILRDAGIPVDVGLLADEVREFLAPHLLA